MRTPLRLCCCFLHRSGNWWRGSHYAHTQTRTGNWQLTKIHACTYAIHPSTHDLLKHHHPCITKYLGTHKYHGNTHIHKNMHTRTYTDVWELTHIHAHDYTWKETKTCMQTHKCVMVTSTHRDMHRDVVAYTHSCTHVLAMINTHGWFVHHHDCIPIA